MEKKSSKLIWGDVTLSSAPVNGSAPYDGTVERRGNTIYFYSPVTPHSVQKLNMFLDEMAKENMVNMFSSGAQMPNAILLNINTCGGEAYSGFDAYNKMKNLQVPVITQVGGFCASAGSLLFLGGHERIMSKNSFLLIHEIASGVWGKYNEMQSDVTNVGKMMDMLVGIYKQYMKIPKAKIEAILREDVYFTAEECLKSGLATRLIT